MIPYMPKLGGWRPDSQMPGASADVDWKFSANKATLLAASVGVSSPGVEVDGVLDLRKWCSPVEDQGRLGSCVGNAVVGALEFLQIRSGMTLTDLSRLFVYYNSRLMHQDQDKDAGTYIRLAFGTLSSLGTCSERRWAYDVNKVFTRPGWSCYRDGYANKIGSYYSIDSKGQERIDQIKEALQTQHPVVFGVLVDREYAKFTGSGVVSMPGSSRQDVGGHAQLIVGYDENKRAWLVRNSWGTWWGDAGYAWVPYAYLDASDADDFWVATAL